MSEISKISQKYAQIIGERSKSTIKPIDPDVAGATQVNQLVLGMSDVVSLYGTNRLEQLSENTQGCVRNVYTITSCEDDIQATHVLKNHVPIDWNSDFVLPHLVRTIDDSTYQFQFDEIYLDHLVHPDLLPFSINNVGSLIRGLLVQLADMNMLSPTLKIILPFNAKVVYEVYNSITQLKRLKLHVTFDENDLGVPHETRLPTQWGSYVNHSGGTAQQFIQGLDGQFLDNAKRNNSNKVWTDCSKWIDAGTKLPAIFPDLKWVLL